MMSKKSTTLTKKLSALLACLLVLVLAFACTACKKDLPTTTVTLSATAITIGVGDSKRVTAEVSDDSKVSWASSDETVATVSNAGVVRGVKAGTATLTATANGVSATCTVTVENIVVEISKTSLTLDIEREDEKSATLTATVKSGANAVDEAIVWTSSDEAVATVSNGVVTAVGMGEATITAKRANGSANATCAVTVGWKDMPAGYKVLTFFEQNKVLTNSYGFWNDQANWEFGTSVMYSAYYADSANSEAGKATFDFEVLSRVEEKTQQDAHIQITYRSSKAQEGGKLDVGYFYTLEMDIVSSVAGTVKVNEYAVNEKIDELKEENYSFDLEANVVKHVKVKFAHYDDGRIHDSGDYTNVESALHLLLGCLEGRAVVTIDNLKWTRGDQAPERPDTTPDTPAVTIPDLSDVASIALDVSNENIDIGEAGEGEVGSYDITSNDNGKSYTIDYTSYSSTYENIKVALADTEAANSNTFAVTIKNNGEAAIVIRFDIAGQTVDMEGVMSYARDCALSSVATEGTPSTDTTNDGTQITVDPDVETTLYITYTTTGVHGVPTELLIYFHTGWYGTEASGWQAIKEERTGNVTISNFKFANVEEPTIEVPDVDSIAMGTFNASAEGTYTVTAAEDNMSYTVAYEGLAGGSYANISTDISTIAADCNTFSVKIKNNGTANVNLRFDICGSTTTTVGNNTASKDLNLDMVAIGGTGVRTDLEWDGSFITVAAGEEATIILTYGENEAIGAPDQLLIFIDSSVYQDTDTYSGNVTFSEFKFADVEQLEKMRRLFDRRFY